MDQGAPTFDFKYDGAGPDKGGTDVFTVAGRELVKKQSRRRLCSLCPVTNLKDIGINTRTGVDERYKVPFCCIGK